MDAVAPQMWHSRLSAHSTAIESVEMAPKKD